MESFPLCAYCYRQYIPTTTYRSAHCSDECRQLHMAMLIEQPTVQIPTTHTWAAPTASSQRNLTRGYPESSTPSRTRAVLPAAHRNQVDALCLPANGLNPVYIRVTLQEPAAYPGTSASLAPEPDLSAIFQPGVSLETHVFHTQVDGTRLKCPLHLFYRSTFRRDGSPLNQCVRNMVQGRAEYPWAGDIVVLKFNGTRQRGYTDIQDADIPPLGYYFLYTNFES